MVEIKTKACERCNKEFDIDTAYLCLSCATLIPSFLDDETDYLEQPTDKLEKVLNGEDIL
mgnify:CR=1 FL=1